MANDTNWDVNKYFDETEPDKHWELRKSFIETHKMRFPEARLICLAKTFANIEFLGCRYSTEILDLIESLANEVDAIKQYRIAKSSGIKRTFVAASDAAKRSTDNGNSYKTHDMPQCSSSNNSMKNWGSSISISDQQLLNKAKSQPGCRGQIVLFEHSNVQTLTPYQTLLQSTQKAKLQLTVQRTNIVKDNLIGYKLNINDETLAQGFAENDKNARELLSPTALTILKEKCFTVVIKTHLEGQQVNKQFEMSTTTVDKETNEIFAANMDSIGAKIMRSMGWTGQGLGKKEDGIKKPVEATENVSRLGLGLSSGQHNFRMKIRQRLENYIKNEHSHNLVFSSDFTSEERKQIHEQAKKFSLKSKSYGKNTNRQLIVSRKLTSWEIVHDLLYDGDSSVNYQLIRPTNLQ